MLTGDAPLTALSVAAETNVTCFTPDKALLLAENMSGELEWVAAIVAARTGPPRPFIPTDMPALSEKYDLIVTGSGMERAMEANSAGFLANAHAVCVYARVSPKQKEAVILAVRTGVKSSCCLMCGDGGNDVGALRQAEVGLALLSGFGTANISSDKDKSQGDVCRWHTSFGSAVNGIRHTSVCGIFGVLVCQALGQDAPHSAIAVCVSACAVP